MKKIVVLAASVCFIVSMGISFIGCEADYSEKINVNENIDDPALVGADQIRYTGNQGEPVVMVHGNAGSPSDWNRTVSYLKSRGWTDYMIIRPSWGGSNAAYNDHCGSELSAVKSALQTAMGRSRTGKIDVMGHSMGATLAAYAIRSLGWGKNQVRTFVGIAGAFRGLNSCTYTSYLPTCSKSCGLHYQSTILSNLRSKGRWAQKQYAIYSYADEIVCNCGYGYNAACCYIYGTHSSRPYTVDSVYTKSSYPYGHWGIMKYTESKQKDYLDNY